MALYSAETREDHKMLLSRILSFHPNLNATQLQKHLGKLSEPIELSYPYTLELFNEIKVERKMRMLQRTKEEIADEFDSVITWAVDQLRIIVAEEKQVFDVKDSSLKASFVSQGNRVQAIKLIIEAFEKATNMKMDLGLLDRKLGKLDVDVEVGEVMKAIREAEYVNTGTDTKNTQVQIGEGEADTSNQTL